MDLKSVPFGLVLFIPLVLTIQPVNLKSIGRECRLCKPGYYASRLCSEVYDTVCKPCKQGTYTPDSNVLKTCLTCSTCDAGDFVSQECTLRRDTVCESCAAVKDNVNSNFIRSCLQGDEPNSEGTSLNDPSDVKLAKDDTYGTEKTSSDPANDQVFPEGSGDIVDETTDVKFPVANETEETEEIEGSGVLPDVTEVDSTNITVILPDGGDEDVDVTTPTEKTNDTTTVKEGIIDIGDGIVLANITSDIENVLGQSVHTTTAVIKTVELDDSFEVVVQEGEDDVEGVNDGGSIEVDVNVNDEPQTGASHTQRHNDSDGVSTGVVVTVALVAAFVFFIVGFVVSRYWSRRQERTFNVQEAERRNGTKPPIECSGMEYKDPENNIPSKTNIYGSVPTTKQANGNTPEVKPHNPQTDQPITKASAPTTGSQPVDDLDREWAGFAMSRNDSSGSLILRPTKPRAESEIRYIDEDPAEERETDALLPPTSNSSNKNHVGNEPEAGSTPKPDVVNSTEANDTHEDENTPMISKNNSTNDNR